MSRNIQLWVPLSMTILFLSLPQAGAVLSQYLRFKMAVPKSNIERLE